MEALTTLDRAQTYNSAAQRRRQPHAGHDGRNGRSRSPKCAHGQPEQRTAKSGRQFTTAKVRVAAGEEIVFVGVVAFAEAVQTALLALGDGDSVALAGSLTPRAWLTRDGEARPALDLVAHAVLTPYSVKRKREAAQASADAPDRPQSRERGSAGATPRRGRALAPQPRQAR
jgi:single-stranded DNA-binding protein